MKPPMPVLLRGDARALPLPDNSVDLICTSPPYFGLRDYGYDGQIGSEATPTEFLDALIACTAEMVRVLKSSGSIWVNLGDKYAGAPSGPRTPMGDGYIRDFETKQFQERRRSLHSVPNKSLMLLPHRYAIRCIDELGLIVRQDQVWAKNNGLPESVTDRTRRSHEYFFHMVKSPRYFSAVDEIREEHAGEFLSSGARNPRHGRPGGLLPWEQRGDVIPSGDRVLGDGREDGHKQSMGRPGAKSERSPLGKLPGSVWEIPTQPLKVPASLGVDHFAAYPPRLILPIIRAWSPPDGTVLDPFSGTGTTALVATMLGRLGIGVELSADYLRLAQWRASDPKERARAAGLDPDQVSQVKRQVTGQVDMFDLLDGEAS